MLHLSHPHLCMARKIRAFSNSKRLRDLGHPRPSSRSLAIRTLPRVWHGENSQASIRAITHTIQCQLRSCHQHGQTSTTAILLPRERKQAPTWAIIQMETRYHHKYLQLKKVSNSSSSPKNLVVPLLNSWPCPPGSGVCSKSMTITIVLQHRRTAGYANSVNMK